MSIKLYFFFFFFVMVKNIFLKFLLMVLQPPVVGVLLLWFLFVCFIVWFSFIFPYVRTEFAVFAVME